MNFLRARFQQDIMLLDQNKIDHIFTNYDFVEMSTGYIISASSYTKNYPKDLANESLETLQLISLGHACIFCAQPLHFDPRFKCNKCYMVYCVHCWLKHKDLKRQCVKCDNYLFGDPYDYITREKIDLKQIKIKTQPTLTKPASKQS